MSYPKRSVTVTLSVSVLIELIMFMNENLFNVKLS